MGIATNRTMRAMAWNRAKGELRSMLPTYYADGDTPSKTQLDESMQQYTEFESVLEKFIKDVDDNGLAE